MSNSHGAPDDEILAGHEPTLEESLPGDAYSAEVLAKAYLTVTSGPLAGQMFPLLGNSNVIGRASNAQIRIEDAAISGQHARIIRNGERHEVVDLGSRNGTFLNDRKLPPNRSALLTSGDTIGIAETSLSYVATTVLTAPERTYDIGQNRDTRSIVTTGLNTSEAEVLAQLVRSLAPPAQQLKSGPSLEERIQTLARLWALVRRNWVPLFATAALCALLGAFMAIKSPPPSEATARIRIMPWTPTDNPLQGSTPVDPEEFYAAAREIFMSPVLIEKTLVSTGIKTPTSEQVAGTMARLTYKGASPPSYGSPVSIYITTYTHPSPHYAQRLLKRHLEVFFAHQISETLHGTQSEVDFLQVRVKESDAELRRIEGEMKEFKDKHLEGLPEYTQGLIASRESLISRRVQLSGELQRANAGLSQATKNLAEETPLLAKRVEKAEAYEVPLVEARRKLTEARAKGLGDQHPEVVSLRKQLDELERLAAQARASRTSTLDRDADLGLAALRHRAGDFQVASAAAAAELGEINAQLERIEKIVSDMPEVEARYAQMTRSYASTRDLHTKLFEKLKSAQLQLDLERTSAKARYQIMAPSEVSPVNLGRVVLLKAIMGAALGLFLAAVIVAIREIRALLRARRVLSTAIVPVRRERGSIRPA